MPLLDLPLADLLQYQGKNPRPADFDSYWNDALAEMNALNPDPKLTPVSIGSTHAEMFDLTFTGVGGARVYAKYVRPKGAKSCPTLLRFHGYTGASGEWCEQLTWASQGIAVAFMDCRGQGGRSTDPGGAAGNTHNGHIIRGLEDGPAKLYYRNTYLDTAMLARVVSDFEATDPTRLGATGWSQGGGLTLACAALADIKMAAPVYPFLIDYQRVWEMDLAKGAYAEIKTFFKHRDPRHERIGEWWNRLGYIDTQHLAPRIKAKVMMGIGLMDDICPPSTQFAAFNKIPGEKQYVLYPDFGHEGLPGHNDKIFEFFSSL